MSMLRLAYFFGELLSGPFVLSREDLAVLFRLKSASFSAGERDSTVSIHCCAAAG